MANLLQRIWLIFVISVLVVIFVFPTSNPAYTDEEASNTVNTGTVEVVSTIEPVSQPTQELNLPTQITSVEQISDVSPSDPYFNALQTLIERYQMNITLPDGSFQGNQFITRGDFIIYLRDSLEIINNFQESSRIASVTSDQVKTAAALITDIEDEADVLSHRIQQLKTRIYLLENKIKQSEQPLLVKAILDPSLTEQAKDNRQTPPVSPQEGKATGNSSDEFNYSALAQITDVSQETKQQSTGNKQPPSVSPQGGKATGNSSDEFNDSVLAQITDVTAIDTTPETFASPPISLSLPEIDLLVQVKPVEEIPDVAAIDTTPETAVSPPVSLSSPEIDLLAQVNPVEEIPDVTAIDTTLETLASPLFSLSPPKIDLLTSDEFNYSALAQIPGVTAIDTTLETLASPLVSLSPPGIDLLTQVSHIEDIPDVSADDPYYNALREIIENYQVDVTLPDGTFKGDQPITRSEAIIHLNDSIAVAEELIAFAEEEANIRELELRFDNLSLQIAQADSDFAEKLAQIAQIEAQLDELQYRIEQSS
ncbi:MAG: hypothetical protein F6K47_06475 [Symploca sp. SIO2E6]|nr:hypothetical protein [Symploca sp. SIO2E6]